MQFFGYREQEKKAAKMLLKSYLLRLLLLSQDQRNPWSSAKIQIESDEIIMHIADDKQSNCLAICGKVESFHKRANEDIK